MNELSRRDLLVSILQALLLSLFPWLRQSPKGLEVAKAGAENLVASGADLSTRSIYKMGTFHLSIGVKGFELTPEQHALLTSYDSWPEVMEAAGALPGPKLITIDDSFGPGTITPGTWDVRGMTFEVDREQKPGPVATRVLDLDD
jgi:hypothetical protein